MTILLGFRKEHAHGSSSDSYGFGGFSIDATSVHVIKEGTEEELKAFVTNTKAEAIEARNELAKLEDNIEFTNLTEKQYEKKTTKLLKKIQILKFEKLIIVQGEVL